MLFQDMLYGLGYCSKLNLGDVSNGRH